MKKFPILIVGMASVFAAGASVHGSAPQHSGIYLSAVDYQGSRLTAEGDCRAKAHRLELHDVFNKSYIHVTHGTEKTRYEKNDLFGFLACDGHDYRFASNLEYQILEAKDLYVYMRKSYLSVGKSRHIVNVYYFSVGPTGRVLELTLQNLKEALPENHAFHDSLDQAFGTGQNLAEYDEYHGMFKVNRLLIAARTMPGTSLRFAILGNQHVTLSLPLRQVLS
jgi:hypothetical protein